MEHAKHTPGPWLWGVNFNGLYGAGPDNDVLTYMPYEGMWLAYKRNEAERDANASLIAAAPELLAALDALMTLESRGRLMPIGREWDAARAAIAKATGEQA